MKFELQKAILILERTPNILKAYLQDLPPEWTHQNEGDNTWSPYDVVGHLIHGEKTDWVVRAGIILNDGPNKAFEPFDRFAQFENSKGKSLNQLLSEFEQLRAENIKKLKSMNISAADLSLEGMHPGLGRVTLKQLLATWVSHDLGHIAQISRVMAKLYKAEVGSWKAYLKILDA